jgi:hypothetical protein
MWEAWSLSLRGETSTTPLSRDGETASELLVGSLGPVEKSGKRSLAVGLGNVVKIVAIGTERYENDETEDLQSTAFVGMPSGRKRRPGGVGRKKSS